MRLHFSSMVALELVGMTTAGVANGGIVGIMTFGFRWFFQGESCNKLGHGRISPKYSQDISHSPPVRSRYGDILCEFTPCHLAFVIAVSNVISCYTLSCFIHDAYFLRWEDSEPDRTDPWRPSQCYKRGGIWLLLISLFPGILANNLKCTSFKFVSLIDALSTSYEIAPSWMSHSAVIMLTLVQIIAWCRQATSITWTNVASNLRRQVALISHNGLIDA